jgi:hypothetical protein
MIGGDCISVNIYVAGYQTAVKIRAKPPIVPQKLRATMENLLDGRENKPL